MWFLRLDVGVELQKFFGSLDVDLRNGKIGGGLARAWIRTGHEVRLAVREEVAQYKLP